MSVEKDWKDYALEERRRANKAEGSLVIAVAALENIKASLAGQKSAVAASIIAICDAGMPEVKTRETA